MKNILVPLDLSEVSTAVVDAAVPMARAFGAQVYLYYVMRPAVVVNEFSAYVDEQSTHPDPEVDKILAKLVADLKAQGVAAVAEQAVGIPVEEILEKAESLIPEYIIMGSHGHTSFYDLLVGSTTAGVLKRARQPVLIVGANETPATREEAHSLAGAAKV